MSGVVDREDVNAILWGVFDTNTKLAQMNQYLEKVTTGLEGDDDEEEEDDPPGPTA